MLVYQRVHIISWYTLCLFVVAMDAMAHLSTIYDDLLPVKDLLPIKHGDGLYVK